MIFSVNNVHIGRHKHGLLVLYFDKKIKLMPLSIIYLSSVKRKIILIYFLNTELYYFVFTYCFIGTLLVFICSRETFTLKMCIESIQHLNDYFSLNNLSIFVL